MEERFDRIEKLLALLLIDNMKSTNQVQKIEKLRIAGFSNAEIADLLDIKSATVAVRLSEAKKKRIKKHKHE
jgi:DNA-directed RNA polymerase specialized sigma24 family protein